MVVTTPEVQHVVLSADEVALVERALLYAATYYGFETPGVSETKRRQAVVDRVARRLGGFDVDGAPMVPAGEVQR